MQSRLHRYWKPTLSLLLGLAVYCFWAYPYKSGLNYQEQYQLFLFTTDYFVERIAIPGGLADYLGEFLTQFYYQPQVGAAILALAFVALQRLTWVVCRRSGAEGHWYPLSFLPTLLLWAYLGDENVLFSFIIALLAALEMMLHYIIVDERTNKPWGRWLFIIIGFKAYYWFFGPMVWTVALFVALYELARHRDWLTAIAAPCYAMVVVLLFLRLVPYPFSMMMLGINYYRYPDTVPLMQLVIMATLVLLPIGLTMLKTRCKTMPFLSLAQVIVLAIGGTLLVSSSFDAQKKEAVDYDYLVRSHQWDAIIQKAEKQQATLPISVTSLNLALAMKGQLLDRMFQFYQNGTQGLLPEFQRDMTTPLPTGEAFFQLGMTNDAERFAYEAQEAIPNHRKSGRIMKRLAECNIINGHYDVARKYLRLLTHSLFYDTWAEQQLQALDQGVVDNKYMALRQKHIKRHAFLFSDKEMDQMLGMLFIDNPAHSNHMAYEYLIAYELLQRNMDKVLEYYPLGQSLGLTHIPNAIQQVLIGNWLSTHKSLDGMPYSVDRVNVESTTRFIQTYMQNSQNPSLRQPPLSHNVWSYLMAEKTGK